MLHRHKPLQPRLRRIASLCSLLHHIPKAHTLPARALEERKRGGEGIVGFPSAEGEFLASRLPAEFFDEELGQIALLQERAGAGEVRWHEII